MADERAIVRRLYRGIDGFEIPIAEEKTVRRSRGSPVYGELTPAGCDGLLNYLAMGPRDVFYDLGAGSGKVVIQAALTVPLRKSIGVELSETRLRLANRVLRSARQDGLLRARACAFRCEDLLETYLSDATVIYTCSTAFSTAFLSRVVTRIAELGRELRFVTLQEPAMLPSRYELLKSLRLATTWKRRCEVLVYRVARTV